MMRLLFACALLVISSAAVFAQDTNFSSGPQYLQNGSPMFARSIATPSISLSQPPYEIKVAEQSETSAYEPAAGTTPAVKPPDLFTIYYGRPEASIVENKSSSESAESTPAETPSDFLETGVSRLATVQSLQGRGYGISAGSAAVYEKANAKRATRLYTNADIDRLGNGK